MRTAARRVTHSSPKQVILAQTPASASLRPIYQVLTFTIQPRLELRDCPTMQLGLSRPARPPHLFHALQDYPPITVHVSSAELYHRTVYPMGMVANRSGMRLALAPQPAELKACSSASHPTKLALAYLQEVQTLPTTQPSTAES